MPAFKSLTKVFIVLFLLLAVGVLQDVVAQPGDTIIEPCLPSVLYDYEAYTSTGLPDHFTTPSPPAGDIAATDNTPLNNPITNEVATLGRVLFYDKNMSANNTISCSSCHQQAFGFTDTSKLSIGFEGGLTGRHSMALGNARFYEREAFFWDERAATLEDQVLMPIQDATEMGMDLDTLVEKLSKLDYYAPLFEDAFGDTVITSNRISLALAQFVRSMVSYQSKFDEAFVNGGGGPPTFQATLSAEEYIGLQLFQPIPNSNIQTMGCDQCHRTAIQIAANIENNGIDSTLADVGAGNGRFKVPSLRNIGVRGRFMHDGRFGSLMEVVEFYAEGVQDHAQLSPLLRENNNPNGPVERFTLSTSEKEALVAFLHTLTDTVFLTDEKFSDPFCKTIIPDTSDTTTAIFDLALEENQVKLYPNPATSRVVIDCDDCSEMVAYRIYDLSGKVVLMGNKMINGQLSIHTSELHNGMYIIQVISAGDTEVLMNERLVIAR